MSQKLNVSTYFMGHIKYIPCLVSYMDLFTISDQGHGFLKETDPVTLVGKTMQSKQISYQ